MEINIQYGDCYFNNSAGRVIVHVELVGCFAVSAWSQLVFDCNSNYVIIGVAA